MIGHAVDHGSAGKHGGDPANIVRRNHACMCLREKTKREDRDISSSGSRSSWKRQARLLPHGSTETGDLTWTVD